jgi:hypothetical protein
MQRPKQNGTHMLIVVKAAEGINYNTGLKLHNTSHFQEEEHTEPSRM